MALCRPAAPRGRAFVDERGEVSHNAYRQNDEMKSLGLAGFVGCIIVCAAQDHPLLKNFWIDSSRATILIARKTVQYDELGFRNLAITNSSMTELPAQYEGTTLEKHHLTVRTF